MQTDCGRDEHHSFTVTVSSVVFVLQIASFFSMFNFPTKFCINNFFKPEVITEYR